jgi:hypothetical protein
VTFARDNSTEQVQSARPIGEVLDLLASERLSGLGYISDVNGGCVSRNYLT